MRKALLMLFGWNKHDLCFLVTLSRICMLSCRILDMSFFEVINVREVVGAWGVCLV